MYTEKQQNNYKQYNLISVKKCPCIFWNNCGSQGPQRVLLSSGSFITTTASRLWFTSSWRTHAMPQLNQGLPLLPNQFVTIWRIPSAGKHIQRQLHVVKHKTLPSNHIYSPITSIDPLHDFGRCSLSLHFLLFNPGKLGNAGTTIKHDPSKLKKIINKLFVYCYYIFLVWKSFKTPMKPKQKKTKLFLDWCEVTKH